MDEILSEPYPHVPEELKSLNNWVGWKLEERDGKPTKVPYSKPGVMASSTDPTAWASFNDVCNIRPSKEKGIGFVFDGNGIVGIDLDHCLDETGKINNKFSNLAYILNSYTEISPSGTGLHILIRCESEPYETGKHKNGLEIYSRGRYFTVTGNKLPDSPNIINTFSVELIRSLCDPFVNPIKKEIAHVSNTSTNLSDDEIITIASRAKNGSRFQGLMDGKSCGDKSSDDLALANILAFYSTDVNQIERIMRMSGLVREKWDRRDYMVNYTIMKAINECGGHYEPPMNIGDSEHGAGVAKQLLSSPTTTPPPQKPQLSEREIDDIIAASHLCDDLPPFPEISHPLFKKWMTLGSRLMYSHPSYHFGNLLAIASVALGRRVGVLIATNYINPNVDVMLVGTSTISGKSFSSDTAIKEFGIPTANIPSLLNPTDATELKRKSCSNPRLIQDMSKRNNMLWYYDEAKEFFDDCGDRGWNAPIVGTLCTAYDGGYLERSLSTRANSKKGKDGDEGEENKWICENPFLTLLFNMTISQLQEASTPKIVGSGFFYRWMWFLENGGEKKKNVTASDDDIKGVCEIKDELFDIGSIMKTLNPNDICFNVNDKVEQWSLDISKKSDDETYQSATGRSVIHIYKIAMVLAMFDPEFQKLALNPEGRSSRLSIPDKWVDEAIMIVEKYLLPRMMVVANYSRRVDINNKQLKVLNALEALRGVSDSRGLLRKTHMDVVDFNKVISTLRASGEVISVPKGNKILYCLIKQKE